MTLAQLGSCFIATTLLFGELADPIAHWELAANHVVDGHVRAVAGDWDAKLEGEPAWLGPEESALLFVPGSRGLEASVVKREQLPTKQLTVAAWVAIDAAPGWSGMLSCFEDNGSHERGIFLGTKDRRFCFAIASEATEKLNYLTAPKDLELGSWTHVVGVYDGRDQQLFVDGELVAEARAKSSPVLYDATHRVVLGAYADKNEHFTMTGALADVQLYDRALSRKDIVRLGRAGRKRLPEIEAKRATPREPAPERGELAPAVNAAIDSAVEYLLLHQNRDGSWNQETAKYRNGITSLNALALLESGISPKHPAIQNAKRFLLERRPTRVYSAGFELMFFGELADPTLKPEIEAIVDLLLEWEPKTPGGLWGYPGGQPDLSNTQLVALGLWAAKRAGVDAPKDVWLRMIETTVEECRKGREEVEFPFDDGGKKKRVIEGFSYFANDQQYPTYASMTAIALCLFALTDEVDIKLPGRLRKTVERSKKPALDWLTYYFAVDHVPGLGERVSYYLYALERVGSLLDLETFGPHDWYRLGAASLVHGQEPDGSWHETEYGSRHQSPTSFALLFLNRATSSSGSARKSTKKEGVHALETGPIQLQVVADQRLTVWVLGIERDDSSATRVDYRLDGADPVVAEAGADGRFAARLPLALPGEHRLEATVHFADGVELRSDTLEFKVARSPRAFQAQALSANRGVDLLDSIEVNVTASSAQTGFPGEAVVDRLSGTGWATTVDDTSPWIELQAPRAIRARRLRIDPIDASLADEGRAALVGQVRVVLDGKDKEALTVRWPADPLQPLELEWPKQEKFRRIRIELSGIDGSDARWGKRTGLSEVQLFGR